MQNIQAVEDLLSFVAKGVYHAKILFIGAYFVDTPETRKRTSQFDRVIKKTA